MSDDAEHDAEHDIELVADLDLDAGEGADTASSSARASAGRRRSATTNRWMRWLHVYTSMISLIVVLFFGLTGITLNHPDWTLGGSEESTSHTGTLPDGYVDGSGNVDFLSVSEYVRETFDVSGEVTDHRLEGDQGAIAYAAPGYTADLTFSVADGTFTLDVTQQGYVAVMNDLHKGRDAPSSWKVVIDLAAGLLVLVSITGLGIQLFQRKRRTRALVFAGAGLLVTIVFVFVALS